MSGINLSEMSLKELKQLKKDIEKAIANFDGRKKADAVAKLEEQARAMGFKLSDLLGTEGKNSRAPAEAKYQNPDDAAITWSGRGRRPLWFVAALAGGKSAEDLAI
jgi:DNA-binding protein H-NS